MKSCLINNLIQSFLIGGFIIAGANLISTFYNPLMVSIWLSYPFTVFATVISLYICGKDLNYIKETSFRTVIALFIATIPVYYFSKTLKKRDDVWSVMLKASAVWFFVTIMVLFIQRLFTIYNLTLL